MIIVPPQIHNDMLPLLTSEILQTLQSITGMLSPFSFDCPLEAEESVTNYCPVCQESFDSKSAHEESEIHRMHKAIQNAYPEIGCVQRKFLIQHKVILKDEWLFCTLCSTKSFSFEAIRPHLQSSRHLRRVSWAATEDTEIDAFLNSDSARPKREEHVPRAESKNSERISFASKEVKTICYSLQNTRADQISSEEIDLISEKCDMIGRFLRDIKNRCKTLLDERSRLVPVAPKERTPNTTCVICFDKERTQILLPCTHLALCSGCCAALNPRICPICRQAVEKSIEPIRS